MRTAFSSKLIPGIGGVRSRRPLSIAVSCCLMPVMLVCAVLPAAAQTNDVVLGAYFTSWSIYARGYAVTNLPARQLTHIFYAFAKPVYDPGTDSGALLSGDTGADAVSFPALRQLKQEFPHLRTLIAAGGWTWSDDFSDIMASTNARATLATSCIHFMTNNGFDGIDLDWEYPVQGGEPDLTHRPEDADNYLFFVRDLRDRLDHLGREQGRSYLLTVAISAGYNTLTNRFRVNDMAAYVDWFNMMTYDLAGAWDPVTGHHAPLHGHPLAVDSNYNVATAVQTCLDQGVDGDRIVVGLPFYGRSFSGVPDTDHGLFQTHSGAGPGTWEAGILDYDDLAAHYVNTNGYVRYWDEVSAAPYLFNRTGGVFVTYEDPKSVEQKMLFVQQKGLRGVMCWSADADTANHALQRASYRSLYPLRIDRLALYPTSQGNVPALSWTGIQGETYSVTAGSRLPPGNFSPCTGLLFTNGHQASALQGTGYTITVLDTNAAGARSFYILRVD